MWLHKTFIIYSLYLQCWKAFGNVENNNILNAQDKHIGSESSCLTQKGDTSICNEDIPGTAEIKLFRWDPVRVGYVRELELEMGKKYKMVTKAVNPPVFVIENYLEDYECDYIIQKAKDAGLFSSQLHIDTQTLKSKNYSRYNLIGYTSNFDFIDQNKDGVLNVPEEVKGLAYSINLLYLNNEEVDEMLIKFEVVITEENGRKYITRENYEKMNFSGMHQYIYDLKENHPRHRDRYSEQVWLNVHSTNNQIFQKIMERLEKLTQLHHDIVYGTEPIQVVHYKPHGHYHAHFDSQNKSGYPDFPCCHTVLGGNPQNCRICRYLTALYFLNDVQKGGETAFPVADDLEYTHETYLQRKKGDLYNLSEYCYNSTLLVSPKKGSMVLWYNHKKNEHELLGDLDPYALHGGCDVIEGEKWIGNNWVPAPEAPNTYNNNIYKTEHFSDKNSSEIPVASANLEPLQQEKATPLIEDL